MTRILVVCLGNICRSPLAHGILESKLPSQSFYVDSAGTGAYHIGKKPDYRSIEVAKQHGIDISRQSARQFQRSDFEAFDYIFVMDQSNYTDIISLAANQNDRDKVRLFLDVSTDSKSKDVPDPYYGDIHDFEQVFDLVEAAATLIRKKLIDSSL